MTRSGSELCSHTRRSREAPPAAVRGFFSMGGRSDEEERRNSFSGGRSRLLLHARERSDEAAVASSPWERGATAEDR